jgi:hypothetical protein
MTEYEEKKKDYKDPDGGVITGPPNIKTMPMKKGIVPQKVGKELMSPLFHPVHDHVYKVADNYDRSKELLQEELKYHQEKVGDRKPFSQSANHRWKKKYFHYGTINAPQDILEENPPVPARQLGPKPKSQAELMVGDKPFNPSGNKTKRRVHDFLGPVAGHMACPYSIELQKKEKNDDAPPPFKLTHNHKSKPSPSVALNVRNLRT